MPGRWLILTATLPTHPSGLRVRVWRALKATGAGALREGVHLLPAEADSAGALRALETTIAEAGAEAHLLEVDARDARQEKAFRALFDRSAGYAELLQSVKEARAALRSTDEAAMRRHLRALDRRCHDLRAIDFFPGRDAERAASALAALHREVAQHHAPGEPSAAVAAVAAALPLRDRADYQGRTWATRRRPWIDRLATAWLVQRFVDERPRFVWLASPRACPKDALGYDFDGAAFTHVGDRVTFEVVAESFGLLADPATRRLARLVHGLDVGGEPMDEAPGIELLVRGLQARHADDDALLTASLPLFDALHAAMKATDGD